MPQPGNPQSLNQYSYVFNNPLRYVDDDGRDPVSWPIGEIRTTLSNLERYTRAGYVRDTRSLSIVIVEASPTLYSASSRLSAQRVAPLAPLIQSSAQERGLDAGLLSASIRHQSGGAAQDDAARLARRSPGSTGISQITTPEVELYTSLGLFDPTQYSPGSGAGQVQLMAAKLQSVDRGLAAFGVSASQEDRLKLQMIAQNEGSGLIRNADGTLGLQAGSLLDVYIKANGNWDEVFRTHRWWEYQWLSMRRLMTGQEF